MGIMTDEQLKTLNDDIESGLVMTLTVEHYEQLQAENKRLKAVNRHLAEENKGLLQLTTLIDEHPEKYDGPCLCRTCMRIKDN